VGRTWVAILIAVTGVVVLVCPIFVMWISSTYFAVKPPVLSEPQNQVAACVNDRSQRVEDRFTIENFGALVQNCYAEALDTAQLQDFYLRRAKYYTQDIGGNVLLWMVVILTVSGVALSAFQLYASYQIGIGRSQPAPEQASHEVSITRDNISVKSAYVGVAILALSFAFFFIFVIEVYDLKVEHPEERASSKATPKMQILPGSNLGIGNMGPPVKGPPANASPDATKP
jgi:hypothetical protein